MERNYGKKNDLIAQFLDTDISKLLRSTFDTSTDCKIFESLKVMGELELSFLDKLDQLVDTKLMTELTNLKNVPFHFLYSKGEFYLGDYFRFE